ncbi:MAG: GAF domain-containing protein [Thermoanaerobaculia bacterium]|jgi:signal transduction histidine kinase|nr:GAF domain-containing protein [Thermoanaerobaculia bacterium]
MEPLFDARTLLAASAVIFAGLVLAVALAWRELRAIRGPDRLALGFGLFFLGLVLLAFRGRIPDLLPDVLANVLVAVAAAFILEGTKLYYGLRPSRRLTVGTGLLATAGFAGATFLRDAGNARAILSSAFLAALLGAAAWTASRRRAPQGAAALDKVTAVALWACAALFWARGVAVGAGFVEGDILAGGPLLALPPLLCTIFAVVFTTTLLATTSQRLTRVVRTQNDLLASLLSVARAAGAEEGLDGTLAKVLDAAKVATGAHGASALLLDGNGRFTRGLFTEGDSTLVVGPAEAAEMLETGLAGWVVRSGTIAVVEDVLEDDRWRHLASQEGTIRSALSAPIATGTSLAGVLTLVHPDAGHFGEEQRSLIESTAAQIALALRTAESADARRRATRGLEVLNAVLDVSARRHASEEIAAEAAAAICRLSSFSRVFVALPAADGFLLLGRTEGLGDLRPSTLAGELGLAWETGLVTRISGDGAGQTCRGLVVPLRHLGNRLGVASFEASARDGLDDDACSFAEALAEAISLGLGKLVLARAREELSRMLVHDLRGPISGVMGALELLRENRSLDEDGRKLLDLAERNTRRQLSLVDGILELSRLEEGSLPVHPTDVHLPTVVDEVIGRALPAAQARGLSLVSALPPDLPPVHADPGLVARVVENLLTNAVKFSAPGSGSVRLAARVDGANVVLDVKDSGPGICEELRPRLFEKFAVGSLPGRGSGLGLPFCRLAIEAQGGRMWLKHPGPEAVFSFSLPLASPPPP